MRAGTIAAGAVAVIAGAVDIAVIHYYSDSITESCRRHPKLTALAAGLFALHLLNPRWFQPIDPFYATGRAAHNIYKAVSR